MKVAIINEGSTKHRNSDIVTAMEGLGQEVFNLGMKNIAGEPDLTYIQTGLMTALALNTGAVDFVLGGCGTGQGYMNMVMQFPGVFCGLIMDPVEAYLYSKVNAGNCVSLQLNKGYGALGGNLNLRYLLEVLFKEKFGGGYPPARGPYQMQMRDELIATSKIAHRSMEEILTAMDRKEVMRALQFPGFLAFIRENAQNSNLKDLILELAEE